MRFDDWMIRTGTSNAAFGKKASLSSEAVRRYRSGDRNPDPEKMRAIFDITDGEVTPNDWVGVGPRSELQEAAAQERAS